MTIKPTPRRALVLTTAASLAAAVAFGAGTTGAATAAPDAGTGTPAAGHDKVLPAGDAHDHAPEIDTRAAKRATPSAAQKSAAAKVAPGATTRAAAPASGANAGQGTQLEWNQFGSIGTARALGNQPLATGLGSDPVAAARAYLKSNAVAFGLSAADIDAMEHVTTNPLGASKIVMLRQTFNGVPAGIDGLVVVAIQDGNARFVSSTLAPTTNGKGALRSAAATAKLTPEQALDKAARDIGKKPSKVSKANGNAAARAAQKGWTAMTADGLLGEQYADKVAVPIPGEAPREAYQVVVRADQDEAYSTYIDAATGEVIYRESLVDFDSDNPRWSVFTGTPNTDGADTRITWCMTAAPGCTDTLANPASPFGWDINPTTGAATGSTNGNNAISGEKWRSTVPFLPLPVKADRNYTFPFTNQWQTSKCDPTVYNSPQRNDIDAATVNLFGMHNRMHDWSYNLGFTETAWNMQVSNGDKGEDGGDPELGYAQSGAQSGSRNNANQSTPPDGISGSSNMYLWQPLAGAFYAPCVDGDYDMSVIGHEYGHAISNRMAGGPDSGLSGLQAGAMGESWSDLMATEYLQEFGYAPLGAKATPMGSFVTGNTTRGIRNYNYSDSPLNYGNVGYDLIGPQVHADGEIWSATQGDIRAAFMARYGSGTADTQLSCANGKTAVPDCPGNRQWIQLVFDAWLLMPTGRVSMVDARNAMLTADQLRFGGANQDIMWNAFAARGLGENAFSKDQTDDNPIPSFTSPHAAKATLRFKPTDEAGKPVKDAKIFVGEYAARSTAVADTVATTDTSETFSILPGTWTYTITAPGMAQKRISFTAKPGQVRDMPVPMVTNLAAAAAGAVLKSTDGVAVAALTDGLEDTTARTVAAPTSAQNRFTVALAGGRQVIRAVQVSALPQPETAGRFQALRQFRVLTCDAKGAVSCDKDSDFRAIFTSAPDAFPGALPRPVAPELKMRTFAIPQTAASHVQIEVVTNQCSGNPAVAGELDNDPRNATDCVTGYAGSRQTGISEFQVMRK